LIVLNRKQQYEDAVASILVFRGLHKIALVYWGITEVTPASSCPIGIRELKSCNLNILINSIAIYMILLIQGHDASENPETRNILNELWTEVAPIFMLKEMLPLFCHITKSEGSTAGYLTTGSTVNLLTKATLIRIRNVLLRENFDDLFPRITFFPSTIASTKRLMRMWSYAIFKATDGSINIMGLMENIFENPINSTQIPTQKDLMEELAT
jgi:hypothetical protein